MRNRVAIAIAKRERARAADIVTVKKTTKRPKAKKTSGLADVTLASTTETVVAGDPKTMEEPKPA